MLGAASKFVRGALAHDHDRRTDSQGGQATRVDAPNGSIHDLVGQGFVLRPPRGRAYRGRQPVDWLCCPPAALRRRHRGLAESGQVIRVQDEHHLSAHDQSPKKTQAPRGWVEGRIREGANPLQALDREPKRSTLQTKQQHGCLTVKIGAWPLMREQAARVEYRHDSTPDSKYPRPPLDRAGQALHVLLADNGDQVLVGEKVSMAALTEAKVAFCSRSS